MLHIIADVEYERFLEAIETDDINPRKRFCDYGDFEDEYSHNEIRSASAGFLSEVGKYIDNTGIPYRARYGVDCVFVEKTDG